MVQSGSRSVERMLSIIVPVYNEQESLEAFYEELSHFLAKIGKKYEILFIDDGSTDKSLQILKKFHQKDKRIRVFSFRINQGKAEALTLGFQKAVGEYVITIDADLQDMPSEIKKLLAKASEGWDMVNGWRKKRQDPMPKVLSSRFFNFFARIFWGLHLHDYNCGLKLYTKDAAKSLRLYGGIHRFIPLLAYQQGFNIAEIPVVHQKRRFGKSKYGFSKLWKDLPDIFTVLFLARYSKRPLHFFGMVGGAMFTLGFFILVYLTILRLQGQTIGRRPLLLFGILFVLGGFQIFFTGFLAELITHISQNGKIHFPIKYSSDDDK